MNDFLENFVIQSLNWMEANLRVQGDPLRNERANFGVQHMCIKTSRISCCILSCYVDELIMLNIVEELRSGDFV